MVCELESPEVLAAALQPIIHMINRSTLEQFQEFILPFIKNIFQMPKSVQVSFDICKNMSFCACVCVCIHSFFFDYSIVDDCCCCCCCFAKLRIFFSCLLV